jgi:hypothetical protein
MGFVAIQRRVRQTLCDRRAGKGFYQSERFGAFKREHPYEIDSGGMIYNKKLSDLRTLNYAY